MKWHYSATTDTHTLVDCGATISKNSIDWTIKVRNRNGGYNYAYASSLPAAKRKAAKMMREEQR